MSTEQADPHAAREPSEQELREAYETEMRRVTASDMLLQAAVSMLNVGGYRLGLAGPGADAAGGPDEQVRDLEQVQDAIEGVRALLPILERRRPQELRPLRDALSQLQMAYAREAGAQAQAAQPGAAPADAGQAPEPSASATGAEKESPAQPKQPGPGPAEASGRLWVPGR